MHSEHLKYQWTILRHFNINMDCATTLTLAYCVFHIFCEIYAEQVSLPKDVYQSPYFFIGIHKDAMKLSCDSRVGKVDREHMRAEIFELRIARYTKV